MQPKFNYIHQPSFWHWTIYLLLGAALWGVTYVGSFRSADTSVAELSQLLADHTADSIWQNVASYVLTLLNTWLIVFYSLKISNTRLPAITFLLLIVVWESSHADVESHLALFLFSYALLCFLDIFNNPKAAERVFFSSLLIGSASFLFNDLLFVIPLFWVGLILLRNFSLRTFLASLMGLAAVLLIYMAVVRSLNLALELPVPEFRLSFSSGDLMLPTILYVGSLFILALITLIGSLDNLRQKLVESRRKTGFILMLLVLFMLLFFLQVDFKAGLLPFIAMCFSLLITNSYSSRRIHLYNLIFLAFIVVNLFFVAFNFIW